MMKRLITIIDQLMIVFVTILILGLVYVFYSNSKPLQVVVINQSDTNISDLTLRVKDTKIQASNILPGQSKTFYVDISGEGTAILEINKSDSSLFETEKYYVEPGYTIEVDVYSDRVQANYDRLF